MFNPFVAAFGEEGGGDASGHHRPRQIERDHGDISLREPFSQRMIDRTAAASAEKLAKQIERSASPRAVAEETGRVLRNGLVNALGDNVGLMTLMLLDEEAEDETAGGDIDAEVDGTINLLVRLISF